MEGRDVPNKTTENDPDEEQPGVMEGCETSIVYKISP